MKDNKQLGPCTLLKQNAKNHSYWLRAFMKNEDSYLLAKWFDSASDASKYGENLEKIGYTVVYDYDAVADKYRVQVYM